MAWAGQAPPQGAFSPPPEVEGFPQCGASPGRKEAVLVWTRGVPTALAGEARGWVGAWAQAS